jgi:hypothetical protein
MYEPVWKTLESVGEATKEKYFGRFLIRPFLKHRDRADAVRLTELYARGIIEDRMQRSFLMTVAFLKHHVVDFKEADWWKDDDGMFGLNIEDEQPIWDMWDLVVAVQKEVTEPSEPQDSGAPPPEPQANE